MKKILLPFIVTLVTINGLSAQANRPVRIAFAIQPASSWIAPEGNILEKDANSIGFSYGIITDFMLAGNPNYAFSTGILINSQGGTLTNSNYHDGDTLQMGSFAESTEKYRLQYLDIPLTLKLKTNEIGYLTYYGQFGLDLSFNIKARANVDYKFPEGGAVEIEDEDVSDEIALFRTALQVGAGIEYNISGDTYIVGGIVWNNGLTNVFSKDYVRVNADGSPSFTENNELREGNKVDAFNNYLGLTLAVFF
jgi:hypothetical protein